MAIQATGRVIRDRLGLELFLERRVAAPLAEVEAWLLADSSALVDESTDASLVEVDGSTFVYLRRRLANAREAGQVAPALEFALDRLIADVTDAPQPELDGYVPSQQPYYERIAMDGDPVSWPPS